jgi:hypothetical protein
VVCMRFVIDGGAHHDGSDGFAGSALFARSTSLITFRAITCYAGLIASLISVNCVNTWPRSTATQADHRSILN